MSDPKSVSCTSNLKLKAKVVSEGRKVVGLLVTSSPHVDSEELVQKFCEEYPEGNAAVEVTGDGFIISAGKKIALFETTDQGFLKKLERLLKGRGKLVAQHNTSDVMFNTFALVHPDYQGRIAELAMAS